MPHYKFEDFTFDPARYCLTHKGEKVALRPKALKLLGLLIENRHRLVPKSEIMSSVWGANYARDHLLFQLVGELRKYPLRSDFVRTQPNEGYQWNITTKVVNRRSFTPKLIAASFITAVVCLSLLVIPASNKVKNSSAQTVQLPAYSALSKGIVALESGEKDRAIEWFEFALIENPHSVESSLFLAETLYQQNRSKESSQYLQTLLGKESLSAYNKATATNLLSRIRERQGRFGDALRYAQKSIETEVLGQCSVDFVERRIHKLESELGFDVTVSVTQTGSSEARVKGDVALPENYVDQCEQLQPSNDETSSCQPLKNDGLAYVGRREISASMPS